MIQAGNQGLIKTIKPEDITEYGFSIDNLKSTLNVFSNDETLQSFQFDLEIRTRVQPLTTSDANWYNTTLVAISFELHACEEENYLDALVS